MDAFQKRDEAMINSLIHPYLGVRFIYAPGAVDFIYKEQGVSFDYQALGWPDDWAEYRFYDIVASDKKVRYEALPDYDCSEERWDKPDGIYCDTTAVNRLLSSIAQAHNEWFDGKWTEKEIDCLIKLEDISREVVVLGSKGHFIFYMTRYDDDWWLSAIRFYDPCSA